MTNEIDDDEYKYRFWLKALNERKTKGGVDEFLEKEIDEDSENWFKIIFNYYNNFAIKSKENFELARTLAEKSSAESI